MRYFDTFTGIGGFTLGIQQVLPEATCVGYSEIDKYASSIYKYHYPKHKNYGDITTINTATIPDFDLLVGGFPCQAFSIAGKRGGFEDTRGTLFFDLARILRTKRPRNFIFENVKGLLSHDNGNTFKTIISTLAELGYSLEWQVLNSKNHGVPQNRERVYIIGHLGGITGRQVFPIGQNAGKCDEVEQQQTQITGTINTSMSKGGNKQDSNSRVLIQVIESKLNAQIRRLTPTECERLQSFPDGWTKYGVNEKGQTVEISDTQRYKTLGNAVTVNVIKYLANRLASTCQFA